MLKIFENSEFGQVRTLEENGKVLFCGSDVAKALGYAIPSKAVNTHCKGVSKMEVPTNGGLQEMLFIPESDLYRLIISSKLAEAEKFERWVFEEVLPSIRKTGSYAQVSLSPADILLLQAQSLKALELKQAENEKAIAHTNARLDMVKETMQLSPNAWRKECRDLIAKIAQTMEGDSMAFQKKMVSCMN